MAAFDPAAMYAADFLLTDGLEAVSLHRVGLDGTSEEATLTVRAFRRAVRGEVASLGGDAQGAPDRVRWHLHGPDLSTPPRRGDRVAQASAVWVVLSVEQASMSTRYVCECQRLA